MIRQPRPAAVAAASPEVRAYVATLEHLLDVVSEERDVALLLVRGAGDALVERWQKLTAETRAKVTR